MALNNSGPISLRGTTAGQSIQQELGLSGQISLLDSAVRTLAGVPTGPVTMPTNFYGKANAFVFNQTISSNTNDYNLRNAAIAAGWDQVLALNATVTINPGVFVGSSSTGSAAFQTGSSFPAGSTLSIINNGSIVGRGGNGGSAQNLNGSAGGGGGGVINGSPGTPGTAVGNAGAAGTNTAGGAGGAGIQFSQNQPTGINANYNGTTGTNGGLALLVQYATSVTNNGTIGGGGGGGGGGSGTYRFLPQNQIFIVGCGAGGNGGGLGSTGSAGVTLVAGSAVGGAGGAAGAAVNGNSNITWLATGTRLGAIS